MDEWKALNSRVTLLLTVPPSSPSPSALELYRRVWGGEPDSFQKQPNALLPTVAQGRLNGMMASCFCHPARLDFNLSSMSPPSPVPETSLALIEDPVQLHAQLKRIIDVIGEGISDSVTRVAFGVQFIVVKPNLVETNKTLMKVLPNPYRMKITDEDDFIFQINRPRKSNTVDDIGMNFITKWSKERLRVLAMAVPAGGAHISTSESTSFEQTLYKDYIAASVSFDNNTVPASQTSLTSRQQSSLLVEELTAAAAMQADIGLRIEGF
jgi:hypothetical protein